MNLFEETHHNKLLKIDFTVNVRTTYVFFPFLNLVRHTSNCCIYRFYRQGLNSKFYSVNKLVSSLPCDSMSFGFYRHGAIHYKDFLPIDHPKCCNDHAIEFDLLLR